MQKCSLCGGKVVNGRCQDCGMPIPPEHRYVLRGETVHTHEVNGEKVLHRVRQAPDKKPVYNRSSGRPARPGNPRPLGNTPQQKQMARVTWGIIALVMILTFLPSLVTSCGA